MTIMSEIKLHDSYPPLSHNYSIRFLIFLSDFLPPRRPSEISQVIKPYYHIIPESESEFESESQPDSLLGWCTHIYIHIHFVVITIIFSCIYPTEPTFSPFPPPKFFQILILAPTPFATNHTCSFHCPRRIPTSALASTFKFPPNACLSSSYPTLSKLQSTGRCGDVLAPGGTAKGRS